MNLVESTSLVRTLKVLPNGAVILDASGKLMFANSSATDFASRKDSFVIDDQGVAPLVADELSLIRSAVIDVLRDASYYTTVSVSRNGTAGYFVDVHNIVSAIEERPSPAVLQVIYSASSKDVYSATLVSLFNLSPRELHLTTQLVEGQRLAQAAQNLGVTYNTAKSYLRNIFRKTSVTRQQDLILLVQTIANGHD